MFLLLLMVCNGGLILWSFDFQGDRVFGLAALGGFAEECIVEQSVSFFSVKNQTTVHTKIE